MEGGCKRLTLANRDDPTRAGFSRENLHIRSGLLYPGCADEDSPEGPIPQSPDIQVGFERVNLTAERVPANRHVDAAQSLLARSRVGQPVCQHDHARARAEYRHAIGDSLPQLLGEPEDVDELPDRRGLAARDYQTLDAIQFVRTTYRSRLGVS